VINWLTGQINARNGLIDEAIQSFEAVLSTKIPNRKIDLSSDYEVNNELAAALYSKARLESVKSPGRIAALLKTIAAYKRTIAIDSEDVAAHYGLGLAYGDPAWGEPGTADAKGVTADEPSQPDGDSLRELATQIAEKSGAKLRREHCQRLAGMVGTYMSGPRPQYVSRLEPLHEVVELLGPVWDAEIDLPARASLARVLAVTHKWLHERLKPDETAEGRAFALARSKDPAANQNAQSIVIHPMNRPGAPGIGPVKSPAPISTNPPAATTKATITTADATPFSESAK
jgi:hypothetical protein